MSTAETATAAVAVADVVPAGRQFCLDLCESLLLGEDDGQSDVRSKVLSYLTFIEGLQLGGDGDDRATSERLASASAIFLALYEQGETSVEVSAGGCRLGELLRQANIGVKDFMEYLTLLAGRLPQPLSGQLQADLRVMKEGIVVTKMLYGKYRQLWNERSALARLIVVAESKNAQASANGSLPDGASGTVGGGSGGGGGGGHDWPGDFEALSPPDDPEALPRLGWYVYLFTKDVLGFRSSNAAFVKCLQVLLASLGVVIWNASAIQRASCCTPTSSDHQEASKRNASNVVVGAQGGEKALLTALSKSGRCPADEVRAMSARVVEVIEALLEEGIIISNVIPLSFDAETSGVAGVTGDADVAAADKGKAIEDDGTKATSAAGMVGTAVVKNEDVSDSAAVLPPGGDAARVDRVAGVFHPSVLVENATRLDECYWIRVSEQGLEGEGGGIRILDEAFVLTPSLRDTVGSPRCDTSTPRRPALTPSVSRASRQLFQDYQKISHAGGGSSATSLPSDLGGLGLSFGSGFPDTPSSTRVSQGTAASAGRSTGPDGYLLESPLPRSGFVRGEGGRGVRGSPIVIRPPATPVMAAMETVRWIAGLDAMRKGPQESLVQKLTKCETASAGLLQERLAALMAKLDGPANDQQLSSKQKHQNAGGMPFVGAGQGVGGSGGVEVSVLAEAKGKAEALYYVTLEALLDAETKRLGSEDHSRLLRQATLHGAILACCLEAVLKASSLLSLTFPWVLRRMGIDALDLCKVIESFARFCPGLPMNLKYHLFEVQTEIVERLALEDGAGVFRLIAEHKAAGAWPVPALQETDVAPPTGSRLATLNNNVPTTRTTPLAATSAPSSSDSDTRSRGNDDAAASATPASSEAPATIGPPAVGTRDGAGASGDPTPEGVDDKRAAAVEVGFEVVKVAMPPVSAAQAAAAQAARARASTLDLYFRKLMQRAAEVVAELCLRRLQLPGETADQVWTVMKRCVAQRTEMLKDRHLHHVVLCSTYSVCKVNSVTPEVTFKRIIEQYKQLSSTSGGALNGGVGTPRLSVIKDILLQAGADGREQDRGDIIKFYNKVYIPAMKQFVLEFKNLAGQQRGAASISTAKDAVRVAKQALARNNASKDGPPCHPNSSTATTPTGKTGSDEQGRWKRGATGNGLSSATAIDADARQVAPRSSGRTSRLSEHRKNVADKSNNDAAPNDENAYRDAGDDEADDVVAAGAALSALSSTLHPHTPLVSPLPSQRMASPKRVQDNVYLTTVTSPARGAGPMGGFSRPPPPVTAHLRTGGGGGAVRTVGEAGSYGVGVVTGGAVYAFGESPAKDLAMINRAVRAVGDDGLAHPPSAKKAKGSPSSATRTPR